MAAAAGVTGAAERRAQLFRCPAAAGWQGISHLSAFLVNAINRTCIPDMLTN